MDFQISSDNPVIHEMNNTGSAYVTDHPGNITSGTSLKEISTLCLFPILVNNSIEGLIGVLDKKLSKEDMKILNAFRDYIQVNLENHGLRVRADEKKKQDKKKKDSKKKKKTGSGSKEKKKDTKKDDKKKSTTKEKSSKDKDKKKDPKKEKKDDKKKKEKKDTK